MKRIMLLLFAGLVAVLSPMTSLAYDADLAKAFATLFEPVQGQKAGAGLHLIKAPKLMARINAGEPFVMLDVRTPAEARVIGMTLPGAMAIPLNALFLPENLARIPTDQTVVVICKSGTRASAVALPKRARGHPSGSNTAYWLD